VAGEEIMIRDEKIAFVVPWLERGEQPAERENRN
jgi:hypothetical protein